jgi:hypothetical protein
LDMKPCSLLSCNRRFGGTYRLHLQIRRSNFSKNQQVSRWKAECRLPPSYLLVLAQITSSNLKMEAICSFETSVATQQTIRRHIPEDDTLHNHCCKNFKSYTVFLCCLLYRDLENNGIQTIHPEAFLPLTQLEDL